MDGVFAQVLAVGFMLGGLLIISRGRHRKSTPPEDEPKAFIPSRWPLKTLRFGGVGLLLLGVLMLVGEHFHLFKTPLSCLCVLGIYYALRTE